MDFEAAACLGIPALTAHRAVFADGSVQGQTMLVTGGAARLAAPRFSWPMGWRDGAGHGELRRESDVARSAGAEHTVNYREQDVAAEIKRLTGEGVDRVVDVDFGGNLATTLQVLKPNGTLASYASRGDDKPSVAFRMLMVKNITVHAILVYTMSEAAKVAGMADITRALEEGALRPLITRRLPLERIAEAHAHVEQVASIGNTVVRWPDVPTESLAAPVEFRAVCSAVAPRATMAEGSLKAWWRLEPGPPSPRRHDAVVGHEAHVGHIFTGFELLRDVGAERLGGHVGPRFSELLLQLRHPHVFDDRHDGRRAGLQVLAELLEALVVESRVVQLGDQAAQGRAAVPRPGPAGRTAPATAPATPPTTAPRPPPMSLASLMCSLPSLSRLRIAVLSISIRCSFCAFFSSSRAASAPCSSLNAARMTSTGALPGMGVRLLSRPV